MASSPTVAIGITFRDRDSNRAKATYYCPIGFTIAEIWILAENIAARMQALSNGLLTKIQLTWRYTADDPPDAPSDSTHERKVLLLMVNNADEINGIVVPSPAELIFETIGVYAGIRVDLASAGAIGWQAMLLTMDLRTDDNRAVGTELAAGGLAL